MLSLTGYGDGRLVDATKQIVGRGAPSIADRGLLGGRWNNTLPAKGFDDFAQILWHRVWRWSLRTYVSRRGTVIASATASATASAAPCCVEHRCRWLELKDLDTNKNGRREFARREGGVDSLEILYSQDHLYFAADGMNAYDRWRELTDKSQISLGTPASEEMYSVVSCPRTPRFISVSFQSAWDVILSVGLIKARDSRGKLYGYATNCSSLFSSSDQKVEVVRASNRIKSSRIKKQGGESIATCM